MRWELWFSQKAVVGLYNVERSFVANVWAALRDLAEDPSSVNLHASGSDPSLFWLALDGDVTIWFEIIDERHAILVVNIE
jgi:hypothetical protein